MVGEGRSRGSPSNPRVSIRCHGHKLFQLFKPIVDNHNLVFRRRLWAHLGLENH